MIGEHNFNIFCSGRSGAYLLSTNMKVETNKGADYAKTDTRRTVKTSVLSVRKNVT